MASTDFDGILRAPPIPPKPASWRSSLSSSSSNSLRNLTLLNNGPTGNDEHETHMRVYTDRIKADTDYKTLRVTQNVKTQEVIRLLIEDKLRLNLRDLNLFHLFMELRTRRTDGIGEVRSLLELDAHARPLELQRCHPEGMSRFILGMDSNAILARIYDHEICPESNYKSVFISRRTSCAQVIAMLRQMCRITTANTNNNNNNNEKRAAASLLGIDAISELCLFVHNASRPGIMDALIPADCLLAGVYMSLLPGQKILLRRMIVPNVDQR